MKNLLCLSMWVSVLALPCFAVAQEADETTTAKTNASEQKSQDAEKVSSEESSTSSDAAPDETERNSKAEGEGDAKKKEIKQGETRTETQQKASPGSSKEASDLREGQDDEEANAQDGPDPNQKPASAAASERQPQASSDAQEHENAGSAPSNAADGDSASASESAPPQMPAAQGNGDTPAVSSATGQSSPGQIGNLYGMELQELLGIKVESLSKRKESTTVAPGIVTVYFREDLERLQIRNLADLLELTTGFLIERDVDGVSIGTRGVVADNNLKYMLAIDGHRVSSNNNFGIDPFHVTRNIIDMAERIEIIRGPGGILWGPDAFMAVINIVTKKAEDGETYEAKATAGLNNTFGGYASYRAPVGDDGNLSLFVDSYHQDGARVDTSLADEGGFDTDPNARYERIEAPSMTMHGRVDFGDAWVTAQAMHQKVGVYGTSQTEDFNQFFAELGKVFELTEDQELSFRAYGDYYDFSRRNNQDEDVETGEELPGGLYIQMPEIRMGAELLYRAKWSDWLDTVVGWDTRYYHYMGGVLGTFQRDAIENNRGPVQPLPDTQASATAAGEYFLNGLFAQATLSFDRFVLNGGGRVDVFTDSVDPTFMPRASLAYQILDHVGPVRNFSTKFVYSQATLRPAWTQNTAFFSFAGQGNPNLSPETSQNIELQFNLGVDKLFSVVDYLGKISAYRINVDDTINLVNTDQGNGFYNYADYLTWGVEMENRIQVTSHLNMFANMTWYIDVSRDELITPGQGDDAFTEWSNSNRFIIPGTDTPYNIPSFFGAFGATFSYPLFKRDLSLTPILRYKGLRTIASPLGEDDDRRVRTAYVDVKAAYQILQGLSVNVNFRNVFDDQSIVGIGNGNPGFVVPIGRTFEARLLWEM